MGARQSKCKWTTERINRLGDILATLQASDRMLGRFLSAEDQNILDDAWRTICRLEE